MMEQIKAEPGENEEIETKFCESRYAEIEDNAEIKQMVLEESELKAESKLLIEHIKAEPKEYSDLETNLSISEHELQIKDELKSEALETSEIKTEPQVFTAVSFKIIPDNEMERENKDKHTEEIMVPVHQKSYGTYLDEEKHDACVHDHKDDNSTCRKKVVFERIEVKIGTPLEITDKLFICKKCNKSFSTQFCYNVHMKLHTVDANVCGKRFSNNSKGTSMKINRKPLICNICKEMFSDTDSLNKHRSSHSMKKCYFCSFCNKSYVGKTGLLIHMRSHTGYRPYSCTICCKTFTQKSCLKAHMHSHTGERPFTCGFCNRSFTLKGNLNAHIRTHEVS